jgi:hypothetical protein
MIDRALLSASRIHLGLGLSFRRNGNVTMLVESAGLSVAMLDPFSLVVVSPGLVCACARLHCNLASVVAFEVPKMELAPARPSKLL